MKLSTWAKKHGFCYQTAYRHWQKGLLPARQLATGTIIVDDDAKPAQSGYAIYARVSSGDQKADLQRQVARLSEYAAKKGLLVTSVVQEIGSGLNGKRKGLLKILAGSENLLVERRDRLARFGFDYICAAMTGRVIEVAEPEELADDIVRDLHDVIVSMCARLYGKRAAKNRANAAIRALEPQHPE